MKRIYPNCIPVLGAKHVVFHDLEKQSFKRFSRTDFFIQEELNNPAGFDLQMVHENGLKLLEKHQFIIGNHEREISRRIQPAGFYKWKSASFITNAIVELSFENGLLEITNFKKLLHYFEKLICKHVMLKIADLVPCKQLCVMLDLVHQATLHSVQLILPFYEEYDTDAFGTFIMEQPKIKWVIFESAPVNKNLENKIFFHNKQLRTSGKKTPEQFVCNLFLFSEAQLHHTYFNRKLFISGKGEIKNAPECSETYGLIQEITHYRQLLDLVTSTPFRKFWYITKERSEVCRHCEFRFMCIDNRIPHQREDGYWYHLQECNYDPYTGNWKNADN